MTERDSVKIGEVSPENQLNAGFIDVSEKKAEDDHTENTFESKGSEECKEEDIEAMFERVPVALLK